jgi:hypothetical protein
VPHNTRWKPDFTTTEKILLTPEFGLACAHTLRHEIEVDNAHCAPCHMGNHVCASSCRCWSSSRQCQRLDSSILLRSTKPCGILHGNHSQHLAHVASFSHLQEAPPLQISTAVFIIGCQTIRHVHEHFHSLHFRLISYSQRISRLSSQCGPQ